MSIIRKNLVGFCDGREEVTAFDGSKLLCRGPLPVTLTVEGKDIVLSAMVCDELLDHVGIILGIDAINLLGGVYIWNSKVIFGRSQSVACVSIAEPNKNKENGLNEIIDEDFYARFDGKCWTIGWIWKGNERPLMKNRLSCYRKNLNDSKQDEYEKEIEKWITEGILIPWKEQVSTGIIPLMPIEQETKNKVRPVLDFRELNQYLQCHTGDEFIDICSERLREWRQIEGRLALVDLKSAYLQIRVAPNLWKYQLVNYKDQTYCLTRLGFGLSCAPRIMTKILKLVLAENDLIKKATSSYVDDIIVNESIVSVEEVRNHLSRFGLLTKPPEKLNGGAVLGLKLNYGNDGMYRFSRGNALPLLPEKCTRRELFSLCGKLVGHY